MVDRKSVQERQLGHLKSCYLHRFYPYFEFNVKDLVFFFHNPFCRTKARQSGIHIGK
jgi:hypothetical protein